MKNTIFSPADVLLPSYAADDRLWEKWSVIACDQFTSEISYWDEAKKLTEGAPTTLDLILPEAYLGTERENTQKARIASSMAKLRDSLKSYEDSLIFVERTLANGKIRRGIVGKIDLEAYDYSVGSSSAVRATEKTVLERIPPRAAVRAASPFELPHAMVFMDDREELILSLAARKDEMTKLYDFELMLGGCHIAGYLISGAILNDVKEKISAYESGFTAEGAVIYAVGDGNHSLAAAKAHYEKVKTDEARYALCEIVSIGDTAIEFEPIYRIMTGCEVSDVISSLKALGGAGDQKVTAIFGDEKYDFSFAAPTHALTVGSLQNFIDAYAEEHPGVGCDYIHGKDSLISLAKSEHTVGFLFDGMKKDELFHYVEAHGALPRKTFSMGDAKSKRYYTEARQIAK